MRRKTPRSKCLFLDDRAAVPGPWRWAAPPQGGLRRERLRRLSSVGFLVRGCLALHARLGRQARLGILSLRRPLPSVRRASDKHRRACSRERSQPAQRPLLRAGLLSRLFRSSESQLMYPQWLYGVVAVGNAVSVGTLRRPFLLEKQFFSPLPREKPLTPWRLGVCAAWPPDVGHDFDAYIGRRESSTTPESASLSAQQTPSPRALPEALVTAGCKDALLCAVSKWRAGAAVYLPSRNL